MIPDELVASVHMAAFLHAEVGLAFQELQRGTLQTQQDLLAIRIASVDAAYESMWDQLRIARDHLAKLGWNTAAYDEAYAVLGVAGTKMAVIDAVNTFGVGPSLGGGMRVGGEVGVKVNVMGTNTALGVINQIRGLLPEVDWSRPPPPPKLRAVEPDLQVVDDGKYVESVKPPRRNGVYMIIAAVVAIAAVAVVVVTSSRDRGTSAPPAERAATTFDELRALPTVRLADSLINGSLLDPDTQRQATEELARRYLAELPTAALPQVFDCIDAADQLGLGDAVLDAAATRFQALGSPALPRDVSSRVRARLAQ